jgi:uncharacterized protein (TIGR00251 family)
MKNNNILLKVKVKPNSKKEQVITKDGIYIITVSNPPIDGKANERAIELLSEFFNMPKGKFKILHGLTSRNKIIELKGS